jgi:hypothetical protein
MLQAARNEDTYETGSSVSIKGMMVSTIHLASGPKCGDIATMSGATMDISAFGDQSAGEVVSQDWAYMYETILSLVFRSMVLSEDCRV